MLINNALVLGTFNKLNKNIKKAEKCNETASSGKRINKAADDAAGVTVMENFKAQVRGLSQGEKNTQEGLSLLQCVDGHMDDIQKQLLRMREMAIGNATDTCTDEDRKKAEKEFDQLKNNIEYISNNGEFNKIKLFDKDKTISIQVKFEPFMVEEIKLSGVSLKKLNLDRSKLLTRDESIKALEDIDKALNTILDKRTDIGASMNRLESILNDSKNAEFNTASSLSIIENVDMAHSAMNLVKNEILVNYTKSMVTHANQDTGNVMQLLK